ncbi:hypothetical protein EGH82_20850 [Vibrio ponticus]|uniref:Uncharacterized protein n=1 Tax=Vibrio ponticus TaxID=265668 RepID=A0A3N3DU09_9VIBR|nr:hypothetical protein EGH82_20850 [Vibrio ponticus]
MVENAHNDFPSEPVKLTNNSQKLAYPSLIKTSVDFYFCLKNMCLFAKLSLDEFATIHLESADNLLYVRLGETD